MEHIDQPAEMPPILSINPKDLVTFDELRAAWNTSDRILNDALKERRLFSIPTPSGEECFPAFFAQAKQYGRGQLGEVSQNLRQVPSISKYNFFVSKCKYLGGQTPLEALEQRKLHRVLFAAVNFALENYPLEKTSG